MCCYNDDKAKLEYLKKRTAPGNLPLLAWKVYRAYCPLGGKPHLLSLYTRGTVTKPGKLHTHREARRYNPNDPHGIHVYLYRDKAEQVAQSPLTPHEKLTIVPVYCRDPIAADTAEAVFLDVTITPHAFKKAIRNAENY